MKTKAKIKKCPWIAVYEGRTENARYRKEALRSAGLPVRYTHSPYVGHTYLEVQGTRREIAKALRVAGYREDSAFVNKGWCLAEF